VKMVLDKIRIIELPIERLRFEPDPLDWNGRGGQCDCMACQLKRDIAAQLGVPPEKIGAMSFVHLASLTSDVAPLPQPKPQKEITKAAAEITELPPLVTGFDVHGAPDRTAANEEEDDEFVDLPPSLGWFLETLDRLLSYAVAMFYVAVLAPRRERQRLLRVFRGGDP
jgi:hypothetical protein